MFGLEVFHLALADAVLAGACTLHGQRSLHQPFQQPLRAADLVGNLVVGAADGADRQAVDGDAVGQHPAVLGGAAGERDALVEPEQPGRARVVRWVGGLLGVLLVVVVRPRAARWARRRSALDVAGFVASILAAIVLAVTERSGIWFAVLLLLAPLYLTYKVYRTGADVEAKQGAILEAASDAIVTMDAKLAIREFNPAAEKMFGYNRMDILGRNVDILLPPSSRATLVGNSMRIDVLAPRSSIKPAFRSYSACSRRSERMSSRLVSVSPVRTSSTSTTSDD